MIQKSHVQVMISLVEMGLDDDELEAEVQNVLPQLKEIDGVEDAGLVAVENAPESTKALGGFLLGLLNAEVSPANIKAVFKFLSDRFGNKPIKLVVKAPDGRELNLEASSRQEFDYAFQKAQDFLNNTSSSKDG